jgi:NAD(P)-dependent dehydrogenase (short-subunit alcohol dehydrogenase family)
MTLPSEYLVQIFGLIDQVAVVTGGTGVLGGAMARGLAGAGAKVAIMGRRADRADEVAAEIRASGGQAIALPADVLNDIELRAARTKLLEAWGRVDILVNAAGGTVADSNVMPDGAFFNIARDALDRVMALNWTGTILPIQVFGAEMAKQRRGCIVNISSMAAMRGLTRVVGYGSAKAAIDNLTRWLAVEFARKYGEGVRVNAIAPGFFVGDQNRAILLREDGTPTDRGHTIIAHTPAGRFGEPGELIGALLWLCGPGGKFVTGTVVAVDGGFSAFSGV